MGRELTPNRNCFLLPQRDAPPWSYAVLAPVSKCYPPVWDRLLTRYSPVRHWNTSFHPKTSTDIPARLACVKHAASVRPEPGSNSDVQSFIRHLCLLPNRLAKANPLSPETRRFTLRILTVYNCLVFFRCIVFKVRRLEIPWNFAPFALRSRSTHCLL